MKKAVIVLFCFIAILNNSAYAQNGLFNDEKNNILIKNVYDHGYHTVPNLYDVDENGIWLNYFDYDNLNYHKLLLGYNGIFYNANSPLFYNGIAKINYNGKYGYINEEYEWIVPPIFDYASDMGIF